MSNFYTCETCNKSSHTCDHCCGQDMGWFNEAGEFCRKNMDAWVEEHLASLGVTDLGMRRQRSNEELRTTNANGQLLRDDGRNLRAESKAALRGGPVFIIGGDVDVEVTDDMIIML